MEVIKSMQSKIAVLFFLAFMGLEDFKDQCVSLWKILLFHYNRNLLFLYSVSVDFNSDFFQNADFSYFRFSRPSRNFSFRSARNCTVIIMLDFKRCNRFGRRIDCACPWHLDWVLGITRSLIRCFFSFFFRGRIFILLS